MIIETLYGPARFDEPILKALVEHPALLRIKHVKQSGVSAYVKKEYADWTRFDHSIGVLALLQRYGCSHHEQIAGLLHDVSHTVFSHVGEMVFAHTSNDESSQDSIHAWYLQQMGVENLLEYFGISLQSVLHKIGTYKALEQDLPDICIDRLEYNLSAANRFGILSRKQIEDLLQDLLFENDRWFFVSQDQAMLCAKTALHLTEHEWGAAWNYIVYQWCADALKHAINCNLITSHDMHFGTDDKIWKILITSDEKIIQELSQKILTYSTQFSLVESGPCDQIIKSKFRGIDPWVKVNDAFVRLTELDHAYNLEYARVKNRLQQGWRVIYNNNA